MGAQGKLGKLEAKHDARTLRAEKYFTALPSAPAVRDWNLGLPWDSRAWMNDQLGCCTVSSLANLLCNMAARRNVKIRITDDDVIDFYRAISGYDGTPGTDNGAYLLDAVKRLRTEGLGTFVDGRPLKCEAFTSVNFFRFDQYAAAVECYGGVVVGERLPTEAFNKWTWEVWPDMKPGSWGGHASARWSVSPGRYGGKSWSDPIHETPDFLHTCGDEAYALLVPELVPPSGLDLDSLRADLQALR